MSSADPFRDRTERSDGSYPDNWPKPEPDAYIIGEVTAIELSAGKYEQPVLGVLCEDKEQEFSVWLPQYLRDDIVSKGLQVGERVSIKYFGLKKGRTREYQHYALMIDPKSRIAPPLAVDDDPRTDNVFTDPVVVPVDSDDGGGFADDLPFARPEMPF